MVAAGVCEGDFRITIVRQRTAMNLPGGLANTMLARRKVKLRSAGVAAAGNVENKGSQIHVDIASYQISATFRPKGQLERRQRIHCRPAVTKPAIPVKPVFDIETQRGYASRRNPLKYLAPRPGLEPGTTD